MLAQRRQRLLLSLLVLLGLSAWWLTRQQTAPQRPPPASDAQQPDYVVEGIRALAMDIHGQPWRRLAAEQLRHYPQDNRSELDQPQLWLHSTDAPPWRLSAERGAILGEAEQIMLSGAVRARRAATTDSAALEMRTTQLELLPDQQFGQTDRFIELTRGAERITAVEGMQFWYSDPARAKLFGRVRARLESE